MWHFDFYCLSNFVKNCLINLRSKNAKIFFLSILLRVDCVSFVYICRTIRSSVGLRRTASERRSSWRPRPTPPTSPARPRILTAVRMGLPAWPTPCRLPARSHHLKVNSLPLYLPNSVADPWNFGADPDPRIHIPLTNRSGSRCWSGSCYFRQWPSRRQQKNIFA